MITLIETKYDKVQNGTDPSKKTYLVHYQEIKIKNSW